MGGTPPFFWPKYLIIRTQSEPSALAALVRSAVWEVDGGQPVASIRSMDDVLNSALANRSTQLMLMGAFAAIALLLASIGLYSVLSYTVAQRVPEIAIRMALGARQTRVVHSVVRRALLLSVLGVALGLVSARGLTRFIESFLFGVGTEDTATTVAVAGIVVLVTIVASYLPARQATRVEPVTVLKSE